MVASDHMAAVEMRETAARMKAAAWAWYQRSGGSVTPTAGRSEAFATKCATRRSASRFQREATSRLRSQLSVSSASIASDSVLASFSSIDNPSSLLQYECTTSIGDTTDPDESSNSDQVSNSDVVSSPEYCYADQDQTSLALVALHPSACWDCGSTLFDSFELVAMSKRLDEELSELSIEADLGMQDECSTGTSLGFGSEGLDHHTAVPICDMPFNSISPPGSLPPCAAIDSDKEYDTIFDTYDKLASPPDVQSKQAVYDMFCQYGDASKHGNKINKVSPTEGMCAEEPKKQKARSGRMSLHVLAKVLHNLRQSSSHLGSDAAVQDHHHHHHPPCSPHHKGSTRSLSAQGNGGHIGAASRLGESFLRDDAADKRQRKARHIHHHHHHHYHYLFHSDDDFRLQPLDKSLIVAAAGLRSPKINPALSSYRESPGRGDFVVDYGRKWADLGTIPVPVGPNFEDGKAFS